MIPSSNERFYTNDVSQSEVPENPKLANRTINYEPGVDSIIIHESDKPEENHSHPFQKLLYELRTEGLPVSTSEWIDLQTLVSLGEVSSLGDLYIVGRSVLIKEVALFDKYDEVFGRLFLGIERKTDDEYQDESDMEEMELYLGASTLAKSGNKKDVEMDETSVDELDANEQAQKEVDTEADLDKSEDDQTDSQQKDEKEQFKQKEKENIDEVVESTSKTSEEVHGGKEATKDIKDSPSAANNGEQDNKGAEEGKPGENGQGQGLQGVHRTQKGGAKGESGSKGEGSNGEQDNKGAEEGKPGENGQGQGLQGVHRTQKGGAKGESGSKGEGSSGKGAKIRPHRNENVRSTKEQILEKRFERLSEDRKLEYSQFTLALSRLKTVIKEPSLRKTEYLDARATVNHIAKRAGAPELIWAEEIESKPKVMLLFDVGGSTDEFRPLLEKLFTAAKDELRELEIFYFHNAIYGEVWPQKDGNYGKNFVPMADILKKDPATKVIIIGDAWMAESDAMNGGLHDSYSDMSRTSTDNRYHGYTGLENFEALTETFDSTVWINPILEKNREEVDNSGTISDVAKILPMYDLSLKGIELAVKKLMEDEKL